MAGEQTKATKDIQTEPVRHKPDWKTQRGTTYTKQWWIHNHINKSNEIILKYSN